MKQLPDWITQLVLPMPATLGTVNCYLLRGAPGRAALVDTGMSDAASRRTLEDLLAAEGLGLADIETVVSTHHHPDHCGIARTLGAAGATTVMSARDAESLELFFAHPDLDLSRASFFDRHEVPPEFHRRVAAMFPFFRSMAEEFVPDRLVVDGEVLDLGGVALEVLLTPGHTRGHICLRAGDDGLLLTGDHILAGDATHVSMREEVLGTDPLGQFIASLERVRDLGPHRGLAGHGAPIEDTAERADQVVRHHRARIEQVAARLDGEPRTGYDLSGTVLGARPKPFARWLAMSQTLAYLEHLVALGRAEQIEEQGLLRYRRASA